MAKVLLIKTSMTEATERGSISEHALDVWKSFYTEKNPDDEIIELNLNDDAVGTHVLTSKNFGTFFDGSDKYINQLKSVDKLVIATPMTNFNYPATLKNYMDQVLVAGKTFKYKYDGKGTSEGLLKNLKVQIIATQGAPKGWYPWGDHVVSLTGTWKFAGAKVTPAVLIAGTKAPNMLKLSKEKVVDKFMDDIKKSAQSF